MQQQVHCIAYIAWHGIALNYAENYDYYAPAQCELLCRIGHSKSRLCLRRYVTVRVCLKLKRAA